MSGALSIKQDPSSTPNTWQRKGAAIIKNPVSPFPALETLPGKDYAIFDFQKMIDAKDGWVGIMASRGCPFRCTYCFNHQIVERYTTDLQVPAAQLNYIRHHPVRMSSARLSTCRSITATSACTSLMMTFLPLTGIM